MVVSIFMVGLLASCGGGTDEGVDVPTPPPTPPSSTGDFCTDPTGDLSSDASADEGTGSAPAGLDIVSASAELGADRVVVRFDTNGEIASLVSPTFVVAQGNPFDALSFELRVVRDDSTATWAITLITWAEGEQRRSIVTEPVVSGSTLEFEVPTEALPPLANYLLFGATAEVDGQGIVFDDCSSLDVAPTPG
jgi:hypothetical protein